MSDQTRSSVPKGSLFAVGILIVVIGLSIVFAHRQNNAGGSKAISVVAAENFWGSIVSQIGGSRVKVFSIVSDPNADPHEYETNTTDARDIATANLVIVNGVGYDSWATKIINASPSKGRVVLNVGDLVGQQEGANPHLWYNPVYVKQAALATEKDLIKIDPTGSNYFQSQYAALIDSLAVYQNRITEIKQQYKGVKVASTEDIFAYLAKAAGLDLVSPLAFTEAVAEGNDPPASSVVEFQQQLYSGEVKLLVYNEQTVTPLTNSMKQLAAQNNIPVVGVTETIQPPDTSFQIWMNAQLLNLQNALNANRLGN